MKIKTRKRKVQQTGYSFWITLPTVWIQSLDLFKGSYLDLEILENGNLLVKKDEITETKR